MLASGLLASLDADQLDEERIGSSVATGAASSAGTTPDGSSREHATGMRNEVGQFECAGTVTP